MLHNQAFILSFGASPAGGIDLAITINALVDQQQAISVEVAGLITNVRALLVNIQALVAQQQALLAQQQATATGVANLTANIQALVATMENKLRSS